MTRETLGVRQLLQCAPSAWSLNVLLSEQSNHEARDSPGNDSLLGARRPKCGAYSYCPNPIYNRHPQGVMFRGESLSVTPLDEKGDINQESYSCPPFSAFGPSRILLGSTTGPMIRSDGWMLLFPWSLLDSMSCGAQQFGILGGLLKPGSWYLVACGA